MFGWCPDKEWDELTLVDAQVNVFAASIDLDEVVHTGNDLSSELLGFELLEGLSSLGL